MARRYQCFYRPRAPAPQVRISGTYCCGLLFPCGNLHRASGIVIADPCYSSRFVGCTYRNKFQTATRIPALLNAAMGGPSSAVHYWGILGDNFYDKFGQLSTWFFGQLSLQVKSKIFLSVPGNHDYWVNGAPILSTRDDQYSNGFLQYYPQDTAGAAADNVTNFIDFTINPDKGVTDKERLPKVTNAFWYNTIGAASFVGFSGAYSYDESKPFFEEACQYFAATNPTVAFIVGV